jgi:hypothetical protein
MCGSGVGGWALVSVLMNTWPLDSCSGLVFEDDTNVVLVTYGATFGTPCGDYTGDSARYYRQSALE